jgi:hypothetical protein
MRASIIAMLLCVAWPALAAEVESRVLTHYVPQDFLEKVVRTEGWTEVPLALNGGVRKGDTIRIWTGGSIDYGNADQPGENIARPTGSTTAAPEIDPKKLTLSPDRSMAFALLFKTDQPAVRKAVAPGKPLELAVTKDKERLWIGFNDLRGHYNDNHLGRGRHHEHDPLWIRIEVVRIIVD